MSERTYSFKIGGGGWVNVRAALKTARRSRPGAKRKWSRDVRTQGYHIRDGRWSRVKDPLTETMKREAVAEMRRAGMLS